MQFPNYQLKKNGNHQVGSMRKIGREKMQELRKFFDSSQNVNTSNNMSIPSPRIQELYSSKKIDNKDVNKPRVLSKIKLFEDLTGGTLDKRFTKPVFPRKQTPSPHLNTPADTPVKQKSHINIPSTIDETGISEECEQKKPYNYEASEKLAAALENNSVNDVIIELLEQKANPNSVNINNQSLLTIATCRNNLELMKLLLDHKASIELKDSNDFTALIWATGYGYTKAVDLLIEYSANVNTQSIKGSSPLMTAVVQNHIDIVEKLLKFKADVDLQTFTGYTAAMLAVEHSNLPALKLIIDNGADLEISSKQGHGGTALHLACRSNDLNIISFLVKSKAQIEVVDLEGNTTFIVASNKGYTDIVKYLLDVNCNIEVRGQKGCTALMSCSGLGFTEVTDLLIDRKANVNATADSGTTALMMACWNGHNSTINSLLKSKANIDKQNQFGVTPLMSALPGGHVETVKLLIDGKADITMTNKDGHNSLELAAELGQMDIIKLLLEAEKNLGLENENSKLTSFECLLKYNRELKQISENSELPINVVDTTLSYIHGKFFMWLSSIDLDNHPEIEYASQTGKRISELSKSKKPKKQVKKQQRSFLSKIVVNQLEHPLNLIGIIILILAILSSFILINKMDDLFPESDIESTVTIEKGINNHINDSQSLISNLTMTNINTTMDNSTSPNIKSNHTIM